MVKIGIEIHQRLATNKLFCDCPSLLTEGLEPAFTLKRKLHPVFSELGELDEASKAEFSKDRTFHYQVWRESDCLVEMDEEPPHGLNPGALAVALEISLQLGARPVDEVHIMRKIVIDGSNTGGFQRTAVVALDGEIESSKGKIGIPLIAIEEESAGIVSASEREATYRLDRLGIPLIEITTTPDIKDGEHLREVAEKLGMALRATGKVARGLGTIRQDVNISTEGGARVEIKGCQDLKMLPQFVENEVRRQETLLRIIADVKHRLGQKPAFPRSFFDVTEVFSGTKASIIQKGIERGERVFAASLPKHAGLLGKEVQFGRRYGSELSDYAKAAGVKGIIHSDESMEKYGITEKEAGEVASLVGAGKGDAVIMVVAEAGRAEDALARAMGRAEMMFVPEETRKANPDGSTSFMRPLPGRARMYPETDVMPIPITQDLLSKIKKGTGASLEEKKAVLAKQLNQDMADRMIRSRHLQLYERLVVMGAEPMLVASTLENTLVSLRRDGVDIPQPEAVLTELFQEYMKGLFVKAAIADVLKWWAAKPMPIGQIVDEKKLSRLTGAELNKVAKADGYDLARIMAQYRFRVDPAELQQLINKHAKKKQEK